ncbi:MAG: hypothetical protein PUG60_07460 [Lachnospiraceae bacterium]|nr:hypothetical protein [Lachnospiraceae bacterium]
MSETSEELSMLLRLEYGSYGHCKRWHQMGRYDGETTLRKMNSRCRVIRNLKHRCIQELPEEEYPEEYYLPDPVPAEDLLEDSDNIQLSIFDVFGDV